MCVYEKLYKLNICNIIIHIINYITLIFLLILANRITLKDVKAFLPRVNCKIATNRLRELFQEVDTRNRNELGFDDFVILYHKLMFDQNVCLIISV